MIKPFLQHLSGAEPFVTAVCAPASPPGPAAPEPVPTDTASGV